MTLQEQYESIIDQYVEVFEKKHSLVFEYWVRDDKTGVACFADIYFFNIADIIYDINNNLPSNLICQWLEDYVEYYQRKQWNISLDAYFKGMRYELLPDVE